MLIDTHCHINMMIKQQFDVPLTPEQIPDAATIVHDAAQQGVTHIINVGTSVIESKNCITLAHQFPQVYAAVGIHPNDCTETWRDDIKQLIPLIREKKTNKIVAVGECGLDFHYPDYNKQRQYDAFKMQIELALEHELPLVVHTRQAADETLRMLEVFAGQARGVIHCFSEDLPFAQQVIEWGYVIGIGGTITYPKNETLRTVAKTVPLDSIVLETDAPFLPPQTIRGKQNHPLHIRTIAAFLSDLRQESFDEIANQTTLAAKRVFPFEF